MVLDKKVEQQFTENLVKRHINHEKNHIRSCFIWLGIEKHTVSLNSETKRVQSLTYRDQSQPPLLYGSHNYTAFTTVSTIQGVM